MNHQSLKLIYYEDFIQKFDSNSILLRNICIYSVSRQQQAHRIQPTSGARTGVCHNSFCRC